MVMQQKHEPAATSIEYLDLDENALLLDVDGTIVDIAPTPRDVVVPQQLKSALRALARRTGGAVAFVSGRPLADLDHLFAPLKLGAVAGHGAELRVSGRDKPSRYDAPLGGGLRRQFEAFVATHDNVLLEDKGYSLALHYRLAPHYADAVREAVAAACAGYPKSAIEILPGKAVIEVKSSAFNKGTGVRELMRFPPFRGRRPVFIGDDVTDQAAFRVLPEFGGTGYSGGHKFAGLAGCFPKPQDVREWLYQMADAAAVKQE